MSSNPGKYKKHASVTITYDEGGDTIRVSEDPIYIRGGGTIDWQCDQGDWSVTVDGSDSPLTEGRTVRGGKGEKATGHVRGKAGSAAGRDYKYTVEVRTGNGATELDPDIVVGPETPPEEEGGG